MILYRHRVQFSILVALPKTFQPSTVNARSKFWRFRKKKIFQKFDVLIDLMRRRLHFSILISLPKSFSPSTVNVRSKFWRIWKKRELSKVWFFDRSSATKTAFVNFDIPAENFLAKHSKCSFKVPKSLKKREHFQKFDFSIDLSRRRLHFSFLISLPKSFPPSTVIVRSKFWRIWKKENFQKFDFLINLMRRKLHFSILVSLPKTFSPSTINVRSKFRRVWKKNRTFKKSFFNSKCSFGHVECSFKKQVEIFPPMFKKSFSSSYVTSNINTSKRIHIDKWNTTLTTRVKTLLQQIQKFHVPSPKQMKPY